MAHDPVTARDWQLYSGTGAAQAARALTSALKRARKAAKPALEVARDSKEVVRILAAVYKEYLYPVMVKYRDLGATDTEPRGVAKDALHALANDEGFYDWLDF